MSKVIAVRVNEDIYQKIMSDGRAPTEILRDALNKYYSEPSQRINVNAMFTPVNKKNFKSEYERTVKEVDLFLGGLVAKSRR